MSKLILSLFLLDSQSKSFRAVLVMVSLLALFFSIDSSGQNTLSISAPIIYGTVKVKDNWTPSTAPNYKEYRSGRATGSGINVIYSIQSKHLIKNEHFSLNVGVGYFKQKFEVKRPFDYNSPAQPIFYTDHYSYDCWHGLLGITYSHRLQYDYFLKGTLSYNTFLSFKQNYTPTYSTGTNFFTQVNHEKIGFGSMITLDIGVNRYLGKRFAIGLSVLTPIYTRWRNDKIFKDDPTTHYTPKFAAGALCSLSYRIK